MPSSDACGETQPHTCATRESLTYPAMPMDGAQPNFFTFNGKAFPATDTVRMKVGETLKVRMIGSNNGFIHPIHIHGGPFIVVARDGQTLPIGAREMLNLLCDGIRLSSMPNGAHLGGRGWICCGVRRKRKPRTSDPGFLIR